MAYVVPEILVTEVAPPVAIIYSPDASAVAG
jgi:hypothetical protein